MRKKILAGNWKMNLSKSEAKELILQINRFVVTHDQKSTVIISPPFVYLYKATDTLHSNQVQVAAQDVSAYENGAYTGEVSASMLKSMEVEYCIVGHSERREYHKELDEVLKNKVDQVLKNNISPIFCCGESLEQRESDITLEVIDAQIKNALFHLSEEEFSKVVIAYEPVWAIGTGKVATAEQAQEVHKHIRSVVAKKYSQETADNVSILYGGSVKPDNAAELFSQEDIDGGLIGGASLKSADFIKLIELLDRS